MGGLCGWIGQRAANTAAEPLLARMAAGLPPLAGGQAHSWSQPDGAVLVRAARQGADLYDSNDLIAAIEGRPRGNTPALSEAARSRGHAAAVAEAYREHGETLFEHLSGAFSVCVFDRGAKRLLLAIDRTGIHTLCYAPIDDGGLAFGSTTDCVRAHPSVGATVPPQAVFDYLYMTVVPAPRTIYGEQRKLLPAQFLVHENGTTRTGFYWRMPYELQSNQGQDALGEELMGLLRQAIVRSANGNDPSSYGAFLSGGLDSSTVAGLLTEIGPSPAQTFTIGFDENAFDEMHYAHIAARHFSTRQFDYMLTPRDVSDLAPRMAKVFDEPFGNSSAVPAYYCARMAREHGIHLMFAGDGGDEIFAGNKRYVEHLKFGRYGHLPRWFREGMLEPVIFGFPGVGGIRKVRSARRFLRMLKLPLPDRWEAANPFHGERAAVAFSDDALEGITIDAPLEGMREVFEATQSDSDLQRMMHLDLKVTLADNDLRKVGRMCALAGVEVCYPFLDDDVVAFSARVPPALMTKDDQLRHFFKEAVRGFLPPEILVKKKHGFGMPFGEWPKTDPTLRAMVCDSLLAFRNRGYLRSDFLESLADGRARSETTEYDGTAWDIMMLELWFQARENQPFEQSAADAIP